MAWQYRLCNTHIHAFLCTRMSKSLIHALKISTTFGRFLILLSAGLRECCGCSFPGSSKIVLPQIERLAVDRSLYRYSPPARMGYAMASFALGCCKSMWIILVPFLPFLKGIRDILSCLFIPWTQGSPRPKNCSFYPFCVYESHPFSSAFFNLENTDSATDFE